MKEKESRPLIGNENAGVWKNINGAAGVKGVYELAKAVQSSGELTLDLIVHDENVSPTNNNNIVRVHFKGFIYGYRVTLRETAMEYKDLQYVDSNEDEESSWFGEVADSAYLKRFMEARIFPEQVSYDEVKHYCVMALEEVIEIITDATPTVTHLNGRQTTK